jgi:hypothetical protein
MQAINQKFVWLILVIIIFSLQVNAQEKTFDESVLSEKGKKAYQTLLKVEFFEQGGMGYSGESSDGTKAFRVLLAEGNTIAIVAFKQLTKNASIAGGLYGLLGLKTLKCDCFQEGADEFKLIRTSNSNKESLRFESGCTLHLKLANNKDKKEFIELLFNSWAK